MAILREWWIAQDRAGNRFVVCREMDEFEYRTQDKYLTVHGGPYDERDLKDAHWDLIRPLDISPGSDDAVMETE